MPNAITERLNNRSLDVHLSFLALGATLFISFFLPQLTLIFHFLVIAGSSLPMQMHTNS
jgi:hypothetical protein